MIRRAASVTMEFRGASLIATNFVAKTSSALSPLGASLLAASDDWSDPGALACGCTGVPAAAIECELTALIDARLLMVAGTEAADRDQDYRQAFVWGAAAGAYHFGIRDSAYMTPQQAAMAQAERVATKPTVPLFCDHAGRADAIALPAPPHPGDGPELWTTMRARRSYRGHADEPVPLAALAACLFAGLGITGFVKGSFEGEGFLPFSMTPSGGGRNPFEAYVYAARVEGLAPGTYHYAAVDHSLAPVERERLPKPGDVLAGQPWFDQTAALILLVAGFERTMWKYPHPTGYRVVVLEAGHIAQNILLAATALGLAATPTCAIADAEAEALTHATAITQTTLYAVALGRRSPTPTIVDPLRVAANPRAPAPAAAGVS